MRILPKTSIPKPKARGDFLVKGWGKRRGENALIYTIPNHNTPSKPYEKGITVSEWEQAYVHISSGADFTRVWFNQNMPHCATEGGCNFTTIGGVFVLLNLAVYKEQGVYSPRR